MREYQPTGCAIILALDLQSLEIITKEVLNSSMPFVDMIDKDSLNILDHISGEAFKLWNSIDPAQIAYLIKQSGKDEWSNPDVVEYFYGLSVEDIILDCVDNILSNDLADIMSDCFGPGEECQYHLYIKNFDEEVTEEKMREISDKFDSDDDEDDEYDEDEDEDEDEDIVRILDQRIWAEENLVKGHVLEVTGKNASLHVDDDGKERLTIPYMLQFLFKVKQATPGEWYEHRPGWKYRLVPIAVANKA